MKLFQNVQKMYHQMGICSPQSSPNHSLWNAKIVFVFLVLTQSMTSSVVFFLFEANSVGQRADSFYVVLSIPVFLSHTAIIMRKIPDLQRLIEKFEQFIEKSK